MNTFILEIKMCWFNHSYPASDNGKYYYTLKTDLVESGLERQQFTKIGDDDTITYKEKWAVRDNLICFLTALCYFLFR